MWTLTLQPHDRARIEAQVEHLIGILDQYDGDIDYEIEPLGFDSDDVGSDCPIYLPGGNGVSLAKSMSLGRQRDITNISLAAAWIRLARRAPYVRPLERRVTNCVRLASVITGTDLMYLQTEG